ncbi:MAG: L,D-transpeptidase family protein [Candidatus Binataceae bacterium]
MGRLNRSAAAAAAIAVAFFLSGSLSILFAQTIPHSVSPAPPASAAIATAPSDSERLGPADHILWVTVAPRPAAHVTGSAKSPPLTISSSSSSAPSAAASAKPSWTTAAPALADHETPGPIPRKIKTAAIIAADGAHGFTPGEIALQHATDAARLNPFNWAVTIYKSRHQLIVYFESHHYRSYSAVFGRNLDTSAKQYAGDRRTPEGLYTIIRKYPSRRFRWFLKLNYPNDNDLERYYQLRADHLLPVVDGAPVSPGNAIGIHGTDEPLLNAADINWTTGCISVSNSAIYQLAHLLPAGTLVIVKP